MNNVLPVAEQDNQSSHYFFWQKVRYFLFDRRTVIWPFTAFCIVIIVVGLLNLAFNQAENNAKSNMKNLNLTLEARLNDGLIDDTQQDILSLSKELPENIYAQNHLDKKSVEKIQNLVGLFPDLGGVDILSPTGKVIYISRKNAKDDFNPLHYWHFLQQRISNANQHIIFFPDSHENHLHFAFPVLEKDKSVKGWLVGTLNLSSIKILFDKVNLESRKEDIFLYYLSGSSIRLIDSSNNSAIFRSIDGVMHQINSHLDEGFLYGAGDEGNKTWLFEYRKIGDTPFVIVTGIKRSEYLADLQYIAIAIFLIGLVLIFLIIKFNSRLKSIRRRERLAVEELRYSEERIRLLMHSMGHAILCVDANGVCSFSNLKCAQIFGFDNPKKMIGLNIEKYFNNSKGVNRQLVKDIFKVFDDNREFHCENCSFISPDNQIMPIEVRAYASSNGSQWEGAILTLQDISVRKEQEQRVAYMAYHDALTGLPNRWSLHETVTEIISTADSRNEIIALLYVDLDNFKTINDSLGHFAGDELLKTIANRFVKLQPGLHEVTRLGGDEYLILIRNVQSKSQLEELLGVIIDRVSQPIQIENHAFSVTPSIGVAMYPEHGTSFDSLLKAADLALYKAKDEGRSTYRFYATSMGEEGLKRLTIESELRQAFEQRQLTIHYQPQIDLTDNQVIGLEALLRWQHPTQGFISPSEFIPIAEVCGLIVPISNWLLDEVCRQLAQWRQQGLTDITVAVNCSAVQLVQGDLIEQVKSCLTRWQVSPHQLEMELTESMLVEESEQIDGVINGLRELGIHLSIDDFGTGYSNLAYLKKFAVNKLKIDQSFIRGMHQNQDDHAIVQAIITLAHNFNLKVIAEGVEHELTLNLLLLEGCDEVQGYYFSKPVAADEVIALVDQINATDLAVWESQGTG